jgi:putative sterol carrier protein
MTDPTAQFFEELAQRGYEPRLRNASGTVRFDIANGKKTTTWFVAIDKGNVAVSRSGATADCTIGGRKELFEKLATGEANAVAAVLRGTLTVAGDWRLLVFVRRILPGPSGVEQPTATEAERSRR